jgi:transcriptional regulator with XRE-family HTH domain
MHHRNRIAYQRNRWALSQSELGSLIGLSAEAVARYERGERMPLLSASIALEIAFGTSLTSLFPDLALKIARDMLDAAATLSIALEGDDRSEAGRKREFIEELGTRIDRFDPLV